MQTAALAEFTVCNHSRWAIYVALGKEEGSRGVVSHGWWRVERDACETLISGSVKGHVFYVFARKDSGGYYWPKVNNEKPGDYLPLCVYPQNQQNFTIDNNDTKGDCKGHGYGQATFAKVAPGGDSDRWNLSSPVPLSAEEERDLKPGEVFTECDGCPEMVVIAPGEFMMGSPDGEPERITDEGPQHKVTIKYRLAMAKRSVSRDQFERFVKATGHPVADKCEIWKNGNLSEEGGHSFRNPGFPQNGNHPAVCVNWDDAKAYLLWVSKQSNKPYRLPSESEWEYAARAGTKSPFWWGSSISTNDANYNGNAAYAGGPKGEFRQQTFVPANPKTNPWNLFIGQGNAWQWVEDCWNPNYKGAPSDASAWISGDCAQRVVRGGSWTSDPKFVRSAARFAAPHGVRSADKGFRVARTLSPPAVQAGR